MHKDKVNNQFRKHIDKDCPHLMSPTREEETTFLEFKQSSSDDEPEKETNYLLTAAKFAGISLAAGLTAYFIYKLIIKPKWN